MWQSSVAIEQQSQYSGSVQWTSQKGGHQWPESFGSKSHQIEWVNQWLGQLICRQSWERQSP